MRRTILWILFIFAMIFYGLLVYSWWIEGNANQRQFEIDKQMEDLELYRAHP